MNLKQIYILCIYQWQHMFKNLPDILKCELLRFTILYLPYLFPYLNSHLTHAWLCIATPLTYVFHFADSWRLCALTIWHVQPCRFLILMTHPYLYKLLSSNLYFYSWESTINFSLFRSQTLPVKTLTVPEPRTRRTHLLTVEISTIS